MALKIIKPKEMNEKSRLKVLVYGQPGTGKTRFIGGIRNAIILTCEDGFGDMENFDDSNIILSYSSPADRAEAIEWVLENQKSYETLVEDSLSKYSSMLRDAIVEDLEDPDDNGWAEYTDAISNKLSEYSKFDLNLYIITREGKVKDKDETIHLGPTVEGNKVSLAMPYEFDMVLHAIKGKPKKSSNNNGDENGKNEMVYMMEIETDSSIVSKSRYSFFNKIPLGKDGKIKTFQEMIDAKKNR